MPSSKVISSLILGGELRDLFCTFKFCISSYVSVILGSCLMIAPQGV